jgi:hypothetical protein
MNDAMSFLEKLKSLLLSRRFWLLAAQGAIAIIMLVGMVAPLLGFEAPAVPDEQEVADRWAKAAERVAAVIGAVITILAFLKNGGNLMQDYTVRPPGVRDREGVG